MTLYQFIALSAQEQAAETWQGQFFLIREEGEHTIALYKVHSFYVEVYYNKATNDIARLNPFTAKKRLDLYFSLQQN